MGKRKRLEKIGSKLELKLRLDPILAARLDAVAARLNMPRTQIVRLGLVDILHQLELKLRSQEPQS